MLLNGYPPVGLGKLPRPPGLNGPDKPNVL